MNQAVLIVALLFIGLLIGALAVALVRLRRLRQERRSQLTAQTTTVPTPPLPVKTIASEPPQVGEQQEIHALLLGEDPECPLVQIRRAQLAQAPSVEPVPVGASLKSRLGAVVSQLPGVLAGASYLAANRFVLSFSPQVSRGLADGTYHLAKSAEGGFRAFAQSADGKIVEQGVLFSSKGLQLAAVAATVWQLAAMITAQKYLVDINQSLQRIEKGLGEIKAMLESEEVGKIQGNVDYMHQWYQLLQQQELEPDRYAFINNELERIEREFCQIANAGAHFLQDRIRALNLEDISGNRLKTNFDRYESVIRGVVQIWQRQTMMFSGRLAAVQFKLALGCDQSLLSIRIESIRQQLDVLEESVPAVRDISASKISTMKGFWRRDKTEKKYQNNLSEQVRVQQAEIRGVFGQLRQAIRQLQEALALEKSDAGKEIHVEVTLTSAGEIASAARHLPQGERLEKFPTLDLTAAGTAVTNHPDEFANTSGRLSEP